MHKAPVDDVLPMEMVNTTSDVYQKSMHHLDRSTDLVALMSCESLIPQYTPELSQHPAPEQGMSATPGLHPPAQTPAQTDSASRWRGPLTRHGGFTHTPTKCTTFLCCGMSNLNTQQRQRQLESLSCSHMVLASSTRSAPSPAVSVCMSQSEKLQAAGVQRGTLTAT